MQVDSSSQRDIQFRVTTANGHLKAVGRMIASGHPCPAILAQVFAVQRALDEVARLLVDEHSDQCLGLLMSSEGEDEFERAVRSLAEVYRETDRLRVPSARADDQDGIGVDPGREK